MHYRWKKGSNFKVPARVAGPILEELGDDITPAQVVELASNRHHPLHPAFTWNTKEAAAKYRLLQAAKMLRSLEVIEIHVEFMEQAPNAPQEVVIQRPVYVAIGNSVGHSTYTTTARALTDSELKEQVLRDALLQLKGLKQRFADLKELAPIFEALDRILQPPVRAG